MEYDKEEKIPCKVIVVGKYINSFVEVLKDGRKLYHIYFKDNKEHQFDIFIQPEQFKLLKEIIKGVD